MKIVALILSFIFYPDRMHGKIFVPFFAKEELSDLCYNQRNYKKHTKYSKTTPDCNWANCAYYN